MDIEKGRISIVMLPFLAHGHISPFFELAKHLSKRNCNIFLCSTPINLSSIKNRVSDKDSSASIKLVELHLPSSPDLPPQYHTTNGLPSHLMVPLKNAFETVGPTFSEILKTLDPDLLIYDFNPSWAPEIALSHNIPAVYFLTSAAATSSVALRALKNPGEKYPFPDFYDNSNITPEPPSADKMKLFHDFVACFKRSCDIILIKSFRELEGKYIDLLSTLSKKTLVPVGPLVQDPLGHDEDPKTGHLINWLDKRAESTVVFVCFGSEYFPSNEELEEVAIGLEISMVNFILAVRFLEGEKKGVLPEGFVQRVGDRGLVVEGWAPQARILGHSSTGGFVSHCGWSSIMESVKFGVPVIAMARHLDQPLNAKLAAEVGVGMEVVRDENGKYTREAIAEVIRKVVMEKNGEVIRRKARELSDKMKEKGEQEIGRAVEELVQICKMKKDAQY
uniref:Glycosyltransferase n=2 Tax=Panax notoginseng TaxID=44586 RepID=A0A868H513_9APIA|nr:UDP-glycosyltransferase [Panax notoginseng]